MKTRSVFTKLTNKIGEAATNKKETIEIGVEDAVFLAMVLDKLCPLLERMEELEKE